MNSLEFSTSALRLGSAKLALSADSFGKHRRRTDDRAKAVHSLNWTLILLLILATTADVWAQGIDIASPPELCINDDQDPPAFSCATGGLNVSGDIEIADLDGQNFNDLVVKNKFCLHQAGGGYSCSNYTSLEPKAVAVGDMDGDGFIDIVSSNWVAGGLQVCINDGSASFTCSGTPTLGGNVKSIALADIDGVNGLDAVTAKTSNDVGGKQDHLCLNDGTGNVTCSPAPCRNDSEATMDVEIADLDGINGLDIFYAGAPPEMALNNGAGGFSCSNPGFGSGSEARVAVADFNGDGHPDVVRTAGTRTTSLCLNDGTASFTCLPEFEPPPAVGFVRDLATADLEGDGDFDVVIGLISGGVSRVCVNDSTGSFICSDLATTDARRISLGHLEQAPPADPELSVATLIPAAELETVDVDVDLTTNGTSIAATTFSIDYDEICLSFDDTDGDADNIPDDLVFSVPGDFSITAFHDLGDTDGEIDVSITDLAPPIATLPDGALLTLTFTSTCEPAIDATIIALVGFSSDPAATFGDDLGADVDGTTTDGSVEIWPGPRGDCNRNDAISAADLIGEALEIFDGDGSFWADVVDNVPFAGSPVGCDANDDTAVDAGDISCTILRIFGGTCGGAPFTDPGALKAFDPMNAPLLGLKGARRGEGGQLWLPVVFSAARHDISSLAFSLDLADSVAFDPFDGDGDGLPDAVRFPGARPDLVDVRYDATDVGGELDLALATFVGVLTDGVLLEVAVEPLWSEAWRTARQLARFAEEPTASFGNVFGQTVPGQALDAR